ncbi:MAG TPA: preprotein translocase subunit SecG, partial [Porphyromonadaceae bacterium]|nr:preprotein translocase subunit SecG [Porphyromonadaceae bacterium]
EKFTWTLAGVMIILSILTAKYTASRSNTPQSQVEVQQPAPLNPGTAPDVTPGMPIPSQVPAQPAPEEGTPTE